MGQSDDLPDGVVFDEVFVASASIMEPSAKQRRGNPLSRRRAARRRRAQASAAGWRVRRRPETTSPLGRLAIIVIVVLAVGLALALSVLTGAGPDLIGVNRRAADSPPPPQRTTPVNTGPRPAPQHTAPFAGSPAAAFADGEAGIILPAPKAMGGFSAKEVAGFYQRARQMVIASQLNRPTLLGGKPDAFARRLDPHDRSYFVEHLNDHRKSTRTWVTSFAPNTAQLVGSVIKVNGTAESSITKQAGRRRLLVELNYLFVYPVQRPGSPETLIRMVGHFEGKVLFYREGATARTWIEAWGASHAPARCDIQDGFVHPYYADSAPDQTPATGAPKDPYDLTPEHHGPGCGHVKKT
jgi:hypothetical protein